jgi:tetratricopeptide (TPR) repeat protein
MSQPLLALDHDWHRQRAQLRTGRLRPPPLVASGVDVAVGLDGRTVTLGGLAVIFGVFPASLDEFVDLARSRLHLGNGQARELDAVLNTRIMAMWAWLPTMKRDCYLELDRATGAEHVWLMGPGADDSDEIDLDDDNDELDAAFLDALVLNGPGHWGGENGLVRLIERFGHQPLLVAARVAEMLDHHPQYPERALELLTPRWPALAAGDEAAWVPLAESEHPWVAVQLGRLALRLGHVRAARLLLRQGGQTEVAPVAHFDLGQACEVLGDLTTAEAAFARYASARASDPDAWRRLLMCRIRLGHFTIAEETLKRYYNVGGKDRDIIERFLSILVRSNLRGQERARLVGWLCARMAESIPRRLSIEQIIENAIERRDETHQQVEALHLMALIDQLRIELRERLPSSITGMQIDDMVRVIALTLPLIASNTVAPIAHEDDPQDAATHQVGNALALWATLHLGDDFGLGTIGDAQAVRELARYAVSIRHDRT